MDAERLPGRGKIVAAGAVKAECGKMRAELDSVWRKR